MLPFRADPGFAMGTGQDDRALGPLLVFLPRSPLFGADRTFHVDTLTAAIGSRARFKLGDLVAFLAGLTVSVHAVGLGDHHDSGSEAGSALITAASGHELQRGAVQELEGLDLPAPTATSALRHQVPVARL